MSAANQLYLLWIIFPFITSVIDTGAAPSVAIIFQELFFKIEIMK
jgi:hypothetical protein